MPLQLNANKAGLIWNGSFFVHHSLALVNRELALALLANEAFTGRFDLAISHYEPPVFGAEDSGDPRFAALQARMGRVPADISLTVRHRWPPEFAAPPAGKLVLIQPWEFGALPSAWIEPMRRQVDEVWVPSNYVRECYLRGGVPGDRVVVVPNGVNTARFHPNVTPYDFAANPLTRDIGPDTYKFLFVGGTIARKGVDVLLDAYDRAFTAKDDVVLIIKDFGTQSFYANQGAGRLIHALRAKPGGAKIVYLTADMTEAEIASLYAACDCLAHPYRGEGYGLPIAEAMACGKPTLVTDYGAALDFAHADNAYLIPATVQRHGEKRVGDTPTVDYPSWAEPDRDALIALLRHVMSHREEARDRGRVAAEQIRERHTWQEAATLAAERLIVLQDRAESERGQRFALPMGLGNLGLGGLNLASTPGLLALGDMYEDRKQAALAETRQGDWKHAIGEIEACLIERPDDWDMLNALAVARFSTGQIDGAIELLRRGVEHAPNTRDFHHNLAFALLGSGRADEALEHAIQALAFTPNEEALRGTVERARDAVLKQARSILRSYPDKQRHKARQNEEYRALMRAYQSAETALQQAVSPDPAVVPAAPAPLPMAQPTSETPRLSLCMIVKNEERFLRNCLESVQGIVDEIVIVDTGSTDRTQEIAREYGAILVEHPWNDDFSEARNVSLEHATGNWALWLDADEEIAPGSGPLYRQAITEAPAHIGGFMVKFHNWLSNTGEKEGGEMAVHHACRLFRRVPGVRFQGRIHEQNLRSIQALGYDYALRTGLIIDHYGYTGDVMTERNKHERFIRMLKREVEECPDEAFRQFHLFNLGNSYFTYGDMENAVHYFSLAAVGVGPEEEFAYTLYVEWATGLHRLSRPQEGLDVCEQADALGIRHGGVEFARGYCLLHLQRYEEAEIAFLTAIQYGSEAEGAYATSGDAGASGFKARYGLALALVGQDRYEDAVPVCEEALAEQPNMLEARYLMSIALAKTEQTDEAIESLEALLRISPQHEDAGRDLGILLFNRREFARALPYLRDVALGNLTDYQPQARLAVCCEELGLMEEARETYEQMRLLAPDSVEVYVNLGRVLAASGNDAEAIDCFAEAIQIAPDYANAYFNAGDLLYNLRYYDRASDVYLAGLRIAPEHESGFFVLGNCYFRMQAYAAAVASYRQALEQNPYHYEARSNLQLAEEHLINAGSRE